MPEDLGKRHITVGCKVQGRLVQAAIRHWRSAAAIERALRQAGMQVQLQIAKRQAAQLLKVPPPPPFL